MNASVLRSNVKELAQRISPDMDLVQRAMVANGLRTIAGQLFPSTVTKATHGINPVTMRSTLQSHPSELAVTMLRMHLGVGSELVKYVNVTMFKEHGGPSENPDNSTILGSLVLDEDHFLRGLYHLFPQGELDDAGKHAPAVNQELVSVIQRFVAMLDGHFDAPYADIVADAQELLKRVGVQ